MAFKWEDQVVGITGGSCGIGFELLKLILLKTTSSGVKIAVFDLERSENLENILESPKCNVKHYYCDVSDYNSFTKAFANAVDELGIFTVFVNNAGISGGISIFNSSNPTNPSLDLEDWQKTININLFGVIYGSALALKYRGPSLCILNVSSMAGLIPMAFGPVYAGAKHGVVGFSRSLAEVYANKGVRVNTVCPTFTDTRLVRENSKQFGGATSVLLDASFVAEGMYRLITDIEMNGKVMRITLQKGIDFAFERESKL